MTIDFVNKPLRWAGCPNLTLATMRDDAIGYASEAENLATIFCERDMRAVAVK